MLTLILIGLLGGSSWFGVRQLKRARRAEAQLARIASNDDEVIAVLEASNSPMAERLLIEARSQSSRLPSRGAWQALIADLKMCDTDLNRYVTLETAVLDGGLLVTESQYVRLLKMFAPPNAYQNEVRRLLRTRRYERRRSL